MLNAMNCALSDERKMSRQHLSSLLLAGETFGVASLGEEIDGAMTGAERQPTSRYPRIVNLWEYWLQTQCPKSLELGIEVVSYKYRSQPQQAVNYRDKLSTAKIED